MDSIVITVILPIFGIILSILGTIIALQHHKTIQMQLRFAQYKRQFGVYESIINVISEIKINYNVSSVRQSDSMRKFDLMLLEAYWLFPEEDYRNLLCFDSMIRHLLDIRQVTQSYPHISTKIDVDAELNTLQLFMIEFFRPYLQLHVACRWKKWCRKISQIC